jgi:hypothetical protein
MATVAAPHAVHPEPLRDEAPSQTAAQPLPPAPLPEERVYLRDVFAFYFLILSFAAMALLDLMGPVLRLFR